MSKRISLIAAALAAISGASLAEIPGYATSYDGHVVMTGQGECLRTGQWSPSNAFEPCDFVARAAVPTPAPVVEAVAETAPAVEPAPAPQPEPRPVIQKLTLTGDVFFEFNSAELSAAGRRALDELVAELRDAEVDDITVVGHADRIASAAYNQSLSEQRAASVKRYLELAGVQHVAAEGRGETQPVTGAECTHIGPERASNRALVECLQPDRRAEIEVFGTRQVAAEHAAAGGASAQ